MIKEYKDAKKELIERSISKKKHKQKKYYRLDTIILIVIRYSIIKKKRNIYFNKSIGTLYIVALDNILYNKNNIIRKVVIPSSI